ncbi:MAG: GGDEF domain-containing protein, partial [Magnetospirillum sp.]|nr:GGDEF domain-containing protein [Magnetospirillum sp.]
MASLRKRLTETWLALTVFSTFIVLTFAGLAWDDYRGRLDAAATKGHETTHFVGRGVSERFRFYERELEVLVAMTQAMGPARAYRADAVWERLVDLAARVPHVRSAALYDRDGMIVQHSQQKGGYPVSVADRSYFRTLKDDPARQVILDVPVRSRVYGEVVIPLARTIRDGNGHFAGVALIALSPDAFDLYAALPNLPAGSAVAIHRSDGMNLFRAPLLPETLGQDLSRSVLFKDALPKAPLGVVATPAGGSMVDGSDRLLIYRALDDWPLVVVVGVLRDEIVGPWRHDWQRNAIFVLLALAGFVVLSLLAHRQATRKLALELELAERELRHSRQMEAQLLQWANTDPLTGIANRRRFMDRAEQELQRSQRYDRPLSLLMFDVDHFKSVNDTFGHAAGDQALKCLCTVSADTLRDSDVLGRLGGEEFAILMYGCDLRAAARVAEDCRMRL